MQTHMKARISPNHRTWRCTQMDKTYSPILAISCNRQLHDFPCSLRKLYSVRCTRHKMSVLECTHQITDENTLQHVNLRRCTVTKVDEQLTTMVSDMVSPATTQQHILRETQYLEHRICTPSKHLNDCRCTVCAANFWNTMHRLQVCCKALWKKDSRWWLTSQLLLQTERTRQAAMGRKHAKLSAVLDMNLTSKTKQMLEGNLAK